MEAYKNNGYTDLGTMQRCLQCEATLTPQETVCPSCGALAKPNVEKTGIKYRFRTAVKIFFLISAAMTVVALLTPWGPPFATCIAVTLVLFLVKNSLDEMVIGGEK